MKKSGHLPASRAAKQEIEAQMQSSSTEDSQRATTALATRTSSQVQTPDKPKRAAQVTGKLKAALDLMVFGPVDGDQAGLALDMVQACRAVSFNAAAMRKALDRPHVRQYLNKQKQVFRASASAQNISRLVDIRDKSGNAMAQLGAIKILEADESGSERKSAAPTPGITIVIAGENARAAVQVNTAAHTHSPDSVSPLDDDGDA